MSFMRRHTENPRNLPKYDMVQRSRELRASWTPFWVVGNGLLETNARMQTSHLWCGIIKFHSSCRVEQANMHGCQRNIRILHAGKMLCWHDQLWQKWSVCWMKRRSTKVCKWATTKSSNVHPFLSKVKLYALSSGFPAVCDFSLIFFCYYCLSVW